MVSDVWSFNGRPKPGFLTMINLSTVIQVQSVFMHETQCAAFFGQEKPSYAVRYVQSVSREAVFPSPEWGVQRTCDDH